MKRSSDRILTTFVGSLIRPPELRELISGKEPTDQQKYKDTLRSSVADAVRKQAEVGLDVVSDGEFGKSNWAGYILERVTGFELSRVPPSIMWAKLRSLADGAKLAGRELMGVLD